MKLSSPILSLFIAAAAAFQAFAEPELPKVTILGKTFYYYESKKGETLDDIAVRYGWNPETLVNTNKEVSSGRLDKGTLIYYPAAPGNKKQNDNRATKGSPVKHTVKSGETVYGISKQYGVTLESIYSMNHSAREGIRAGEELTIMPWSDNEVTASNDAADEVREGYLYHRVEKDESLYGIAKKYTTSVEDLYKLNPGLTANELHAGELIKIQEDTKVDDMHTETVKEDRLEGMRQYKVRRGDTWASIARDNGIDVTVLRQANPQAGSLKRGDVIIVPEVKVVDVERTYIAEDPRETTEDGRRELYNEVHEILLSDDSVANGVETEISVAIVLDAPDSNKDMEFARGALLAVDDMKTRPFHTRLTILDGTLPMGDIISALDSFNPSIIISTSDKSMPAYLADYGEQNKVAIVNAFDVKNESYINNPQLIQYLAPSSYFNDEVAEYIAETFGDFSLITAGEPDHSDSLGEVVIRTFSRAAASGVEQVSLDEIPDMELDMAGQYLIYATPAVKNDVKKLLTDIASLREKYPLAQVKVLGRPSWITFADSMRDLMGENYVMMPTRFYFDANNVLNKDFISSYKTLFGHTPIKSFPVYSATAYDIMTYFVPNFAETGGDLNAEFSQTDSLQSSIHLQRVSNWGGIVNPDVFIIDFMPFDTMNKITLPRK